MLHPFNKVLRTYKSLFLSTEEHKDDASFRPHLLEVLGQLQHYGIAAGIVVSARVHSHCVWSARA